MVEKWLFRIIMLTAAGALTAGVLGSLDDIKRYLKMRQM